MADVPRSRTATSPRSTFTNGWITAGIAAPAAGVAGLGVAIRDGAVSRQDTSGLLWLHAHTAPLLESLSRALNILGGPWVTFPVMTLLPALVWLTGRRHPAVFMAAAFWTATALQWSLKLLYGRPRPHLWPTDIHVSGWSFPSGHATAATALALIFTLLAWRTPRRWMALTAGLLYAALMAGSRVVLGVHYPTDVLAGMLVGVLSVSAVTLLYPPFGRPHARPDR